MRHISPARYRTIVVIAAWLLVFIVFAGAAVRLTASGLGCEDWPSCSEDQFVPEFTYHELIEFANRMFSGVVALGVAAAALSAYRRRPRRTDLIRPAWGLVAGVLAQVIWGNFLVKSDLHPFFVSVHFVVSMILLWNVLLLLDRASHGPGPTTPKAPALVPHLRFLVFLGTLVLATGIVVTGTGPHSGDDRADRLDLDLTEVARVHSITVWLFLATLLWLIWRSRSQPAAAELLSTLRPLLIVTVVQGASGYTQYLTGVPAQLVFIHIVGATTLWCTLVWTYLSFFRRPPETIA